LDPALLYEPPFIDVAPTGPEPIFGDDAPASALHFAVARRCPAHLRRPADAPARWQSPLSFPPENGVTPSHI
jgi:hypothetical protein